MSAVFSHSQLNGIRVVKNSERATFNPRRDPRGRGRIKLLEDLVDHAERMAADARNAHHAALLGKAMPATCNPLLCLPELTHLLFCLFGPYGEQQQQTCEENDLGAS